VSIRSERAAKWAALNPQKVYCHDAVYKALKKGILKKPDLCSKCGLKKTIHAHHKDYSKPLDVVWLCNSCHAKIHYSYEKCLFVNPNFIKENTKRLVGNSFAKGSIRTIEFKNGVSAFHKGKAHFAGHHHSDIDKKKISDASKEMWRKRRLSYAKI
jgi:hypothetical protein